MDSSAAPQSTPKSRSRARFARPSAVLLASVVAAGCATVQPTQSGFIQPTEAQPQQAVGQELRYRSEERIAWNCWQIDDVQWRVQDPKVGIEAAEIEELRADLRRSLELAAANPAVAPDPAGPACARPLRVRAAITQVVLPSPTLNVITTALLFIPLDRGGAAVEIEAIDVESGHRVAALASAGNGTLADFRGHYSRLAHAELAFKRAAQEFRSLLDGTDGHKS